MKKSFNVKGKVKITVRDKNGKIKKVVKQNNDLHPDYDSSLFWSDEYVPFLYETSVSTGSGSSYKSRYSEILVFGLTPKNKLYLEDKKLNNNNLNMNVLKHIESKNCLACLCHVGDNKKREIVFKEPIKANIDDDMFDNMKKGTRPRDSYVGYLLVDNIEKVIADYSTTFKFNPNDSLPEKYKIYTLGLGARNYISSYPDSGVDSNGKKFIPNIIPLTYLELKEPLDMENTDYLTIEYDIKIEFKFDFEKIKESLKLKKGLLGFSFYTKNLKTNSENKDEIKSIIFTNRYTSKKFSSVLVNSSSEYFGGNSFSEETIFYLADENSFKKGYKNLFRIRYSKYVEEEKKYINVDYDDMSEDDFFVFLKNSSNTIFRGYSYYLPSPRNNRTIRKDNSAKSIFMPSAQKLRAIDSADKNNTYLFSMQFSLNTVLENDILVIFDPEEAIFKDQYSEINFQMTLDEEIYNQKINPFTGIK